MSIALRIWFCGLLAASLCFATYCLPSAADGKSSGAEELLKPKPRPARPALAPSALPLHLIPGERIALVGNCTAERMNLFGNFETQLHLQFPDHHLVVRNFARPTDEVSVQQRANDYTKLDDPLAAFGPDTFICFFGFNESFRGSEGLERFKQDYQAMIDRYTKRYPRDDSGAAPRFVLVSPIAFELTGNPLLPSGQKENENLALYSQATKELAEQWKLAFVDVFATTRSTFDSEAGMQFTINGCHLNEAGDRMLASALLKGMFNVDATKAQANDSARYEKVRAAVNDKSWVHLQDYRMLNGWYVYGGRRTWDTETFPREYVKIRNMASIRDQVVWDLVSGKKEDAKPDDSNTGDLYTPPTRFGDPNQKYSENAEGGPTILPPDELIRTCTMPEGFELTLFADEQMFPEIAKPVQMAFDGKGRLWVSTMPSYPQWKPGDAKPSDKLVILEDTNRDGKADKCLTFYDKLHCPTGFEFYEGGVLVVDQPRLIWLKDNDGDDKADEVVHVLDGWATEDTHHTVGAFESNHAGLLHMLEGVAMSTAVETPWGPFRNYGSSGAYVLDPRTWKIRHFNTPGYGNPWCYVFNEWGQGFCGDGTGASQHWDTPLSGAQYSGRKGLEAVFNTEGMRPVVGSEFLWSRHFPEDVQGQFIYACVINMNGIPRWQFSDQGGGYYGERIRHNPKDPKTPFDLLKSTDKHFRPVDPQIGPDGALWFGDWANPLIGHMQYSQRDENRDHVHGRIYRMTYKNKPLVKPELQHGATIEQLLTQLHAYEWRTRLRARCELHARPKADVFAAATKWLASMKADDAAYERSMCEVLWLQANHHEVDAELLKKALASQAFDARAAATRIAADEREYLTDAQTLLTQMSTDQHPRVRTEAVRGLSFYPTPEAAAAEVAAFEVDPSEYYTRYTVEAALDANMSSWQAKHVMGALGGSTPQTKAMLDALIATDTKGAAAVPYLQILIGKEPQPEEAKNKAMTALADMRTGNADNGKAVFRRNCTACHRVFNEGAAFGPDMMKVGTRLTPFKIVQSLIDPNAEIDPRYQSTSILTSSGSVITGLLVKESETEVVIFDGKEERKIMVDDIEDQQKLKQSSMPEGLAGTIAPSEFLDLIAFLNSLK